MVYRSKAAQYKALSGAFCHWRSNFRVSVLESTAGVSDFMWNLLCILCCVLSTSRPPAPPFAFLRSDAQITIAAAKSLVSICLSNLLWLSPWSAVRNLLPSETLKLARLFGERELLNYVVQAAPCDQRPDHSLPGELRRIAPHSHSAATICVQMPFLLWQLACSAWKKSLTVLPRISV